MGRSLRALPLTSCLLVLALSLMLCSCGGTAGGSGSTIGSEAAATASVVVRLPATAKRTLNVIPSTTAFFEVHILALDGVTDLVTSVTVPSSTTEVTISNVPVGPAIIEIRALDANRNLVATGRSSTTVRRGANPQVTVDLVAVSPTPTPTPTPVTSNTYVVVAAPGNGTGSGGYISFLRDPATGLPVSPGSTFPPIPGFAPTGMAATPSGTFIYVCGNGPAGPAVQPFLVARDTGVLQTFTPQVPIPATVVPGVAPAIAVNATGTLLHVTFNTSLYTFTIAGDGTLASYTGSPAQIGTIGGLSGRSVTCNPHNDTVYVATQFQTLSPISILQLLPGTGYASVQDSMVTPVPMMTEVHPTLDLLYTLSSSNQLITAALSADGKIANAGAATVTLPTGFTQGNMAMAPNASALYVTALPGLVCCTLDAAGAITVGAPLAAGVGPKGLAVDATSTFLYVADYSGDALLTYPLDLAGQPSPATATALPANSLPISVVVVTPR